MAAGASVAALSAAGAGRWKIEQKKIVAGIYLGPQKDEDGNTVSEPAMASKSRQFEMCWNCGQLLAVIVLLPLVAADSDIPHAE